MRRLREPLKVPAPDLLTRRGPRAFKKGETIERGTEAMAETYGWAWLAPFLWGLGGLVAVRLLGRERSRPAAPGERSADELRRAA